MASYTSSHSIDSASTDAYANYLNTPVSVASANVDRDDSDFDIRHGFTTGLTYDLPPAGSQKALKAVSGGWSLDAFVLSRTAQPVDVDYSTIRADGIALAPRPNLVPGVPLELFGSGYPGGKIFNKAAFLQPPYGGQGDLGRNVLRGFNAAQADIGVHRIFRLTERTGLRFRGEFFNLFNHPNFGAPTNTVNNALFGRSTQTLANGLGAGGANGGFNPLYRTGGPRSIQSALKLQF